MNATKLCSIENCEKNPHARGWCKMHYTRWLRHGDPSIRLTAETPEEFFLARLKKDGECLIWTGYKNAEGYGKMPYHGEQIYAHRYSWERSNKPLPGRTEIDHVCHTPSCVNPSHLRPATSSQNKANLSGPRTDNKSSGLRGVYPHGSGWRVRVMKDKRSINFGTYRTLEEAAQVAEKARTELFGEYAGRG